MWDRSPWHIATLRGPNQGPYRHLVIDFIDGSAKTELFLIADGSETKVLTGTEYETRTRAESLIGKWRAEEKFEYLKASEKAYESLTNTKVLAHRLGFDALFDTWRVSYRWPNINPTGLVLFRDWPGVAAMNGGSYLYAIDNMVLSAAPQLPAERIDPRDGKEFIKWLAAHVEALKTVGEHRTFVLCDRLPAEAGAA